MFDERFEMMVIGIPILDFVLPFEEHEDGGSGEHVEDHNYGQKNKACVVFPEVQKCATTSRHFPNLRKNNFLIAFLFV